MDRWKEHAFGVVGVRCWGSLPSNQLIPNQNSSTVVPFVAALGADAERLSRHQLATSLWQEGFAARSAGEPAGCPGYPVIQAEGKWFLQRAEASYDVQGKQLRRTVRGYQGQTSEHAHFWSLASRSVFDRLPTPFPATLLVLAAAEIFENIAFLAIASNLITYLTRQLHEGIVTSSINVYNWQGASFFLAILGGFIADTYWGRFWTMINFSLFYLLGMFILTLAETIKALKPPPCNVKLGEKCEKPTSKEVGFFWLALVVVAISFGGTAPTRVFLAVDQFDETVPTERSMLSSFSSRWFVCLGCSALVAQSTIIYVQDDVGWGLGFGLPTLGYALAVVIMFCGIPYYRHKVSTGSPLIAIAQVLVAVARNHKAHIIPLHKNSALFSNTSVALGDQEKEEPSETCYRLEQRHSPRFLDRATVAKSSGVREENAGSFSQDPTEHVTNFWKQCPPSQVEDVKQVVRLLPLWLVFVPAAGVQAQLATLFTLQGHTLQSQINHNFNIPPASLQCVTTAAFLLFILMYVMVKEPHVTPLQRIGVGMLLSVIVMVVAATTEAKRLKVVRNNGMLDKPHQVVPMSISWLLPQYILIGVMEVFLTIGELELYYEEAPECMHSLGNVLLLANMGAGNFWASAMMKLVIDITGKKTHQQWIMNENINRCRLDYFFGFLATQMACVSCLYLLIAQRFEHQKAIRKVISGCNATCKPSDVGLVINCKSVEECPTFCHSSHVKGNFHA